MIYVGVNIRRVVVHVMNLIYNSTLSKSRDIVRLPEGVFIKTILDMYLTAEYCVRQRDNIDYIIIVYISLYSECVIILDMV